MADIRCPNCGRDNPDFLDLCQFCQTPLQPDPMLQTGDTPTKKNTGELEAILPTWLKDVRQQSRDSAAEDAIEAATTPRSEKEAVPDLLAGLASQASDDDEVPDWLAGLNPVGEKETPAPSSSQGTSVSDFFSQFEQNNAPPAAPAGEPAQQKEDAFGWARDEAESSEQKNELSDWLSQTSQGSDDALPFGFAPSQEGEATQEPEQTKEPEDLGWLRDLEASSKQSDETSAPKSDTGWASNSDFQVSDSQDLSWLNNLGGVSLPASEEPAPSKPAQSQDENLGWLDNLGGVSPVSAEPASEPVQSQEDDLDWLNKLGGDAGLSFDEDAPTILPSSGQSDLGWLKDFGDEIPAEKERSPAQPAASQDDLSWLNDLGGTSTSAPAFDESIPSQPAPSSEGDLDWLKNLGGGTEEEAAPAQPETSQNDLDWLSNLGGTPASAEVPTIQPFGDQTDMNWLKSAEEPSEAPSPPTPVSPFSSRDTGPLAGITDDMTPDWLKSATEEPSMPPPGATSMDWFKFQDEQPPLSKPEPATPQSGASLSDNSSSSISSQDVDSMFAVGMPDWLSQKPGETNEPSQQAVPSSTTAGGDALVPVDLPSWVQAMRPVEAAIGEASAVSTDQMTEREGPLAGFRGLIPSAPIGSSRRPKAISLKLQATDEQQANASLLEQLIAGETTPRPMKSSSVIAPQRILRGVLAILFLGVLGVIIALNSQFIPIVASPEVPELSNLIATIPDGSPVLVVMDYQPSLVGELEAASGSLLDQLALTRRSQFTFLSTSPNGSALVERLMNNTNLSKTAPDGLGYQLGTQYFNIGYLPGDSVGVLEFVKGPRKAIPSATVDDFSQFSAVVVLTDHAETGRVWVEQLEQEKQDNPALAGQVLLIVSSAQAGPLLEPYVSSGQVDAMISGLWEGAQYEFINTTRPGIARSYWDAFGVGLMMAVVLVAVGSVWSLMAGIRARRAEAELG